MPGNNEERRSFAGIGKASLFAGGVVAGTIANEIGIEPLSSIFCGLSYFAASSY